MTHPRTLEEAIRRLLASAGALGYEARKLGIAPSTARHDLAYGPEATQLLEKILPAIRAQAIAESPSASQDQLDGARWSVIRDEVLAMPRRTALANPTARRILELMGEDHR